MTVLGGDASSIVSISDMQVNRFEFICRYFSRFPGKNITRDEVVKLSQAGYCFVANYEDNVDDWKRGYSGGQDNARRYLAQAAMVGVPASRPCYFSVDMDVDPNESALHDYFRGIRDILGPAGSGAYAGTAVLRALKNAGLITKTWRTMSIGFRGGAGNEGEFDITQDRYENDKFDWDTAWSNDFGQWRMNWVPGGQEQPIVHLWIVVMCAKSDPRRPANQTTNAANVVPVQNALVAEGFLKRGSYHSGHWGQETISAYAGWQGKCGYRGRDADGIPGMTTLSKLGAAHGFHAVS